MLSNERYANLHQSHLDDRELRILNALKCLKVVRAQVPFRSVVDFGCGIGGWLVAAKQLGATKVTGLEGDWIKDRETLLETHEIVTGNLASEKFDFNRSFDLGISIELRSISQRVRRMFSVIISRCRQTYLYFQRRFRARVASTI
jgi:hypothetical protein